MPDVVGEALHERADQLAAGLQVPHVAAVRRRVPAGGGRRRRVLAPVLAACAAASVVLVAQVVPTGDDGPPPLVLPPAPALGSVTPPTVVATRLGAPGGQPNGPAVAEADVLAVSPTASDGAVLRTVAHTTARAPRPTDTGPLVDRCTYTYADAGSSVLEGGCEIAVSPGASTATGVTMVVRGAPGRTFLLGTAPEGTAAVQLRSAGRDDLLVPTAAAGGPYGDRPAWVSWWPRVETQVVALARDGSELARTRLPSPVPVRASDDDPELGTVELDPETSRGLQGISRRGTAAEAAPLRVDVLARLELAPDVVLFTYGRTDAQESCTYSVVQDLTGTGSRGGGGGGGCGSGIVPGGLSLSRSSSPLEDGPGSQLLQGSAPAGTDRVVLSSPGRTSLTVPAFDGGARWQGRAWFSASWPAAAPTSVQALDDEGRVLAEQTDAGLDPDAFDVDYLAAYASCLEAAGVAVTRIPQPQSVGPAYSWNLMALPAERRQELERQCALEGKAAVRR